MRRSLERGSQTHYGWAASGSLMAFSELGCKGEGLGSRSHLAGKFHIWGMRVPVKGWGGTVRNHPFSCFESDSALHRLIPFFSFLAYKRGR